MGYILSGVANVDLYDGDELFAQARTLIDSSISISVTAEEIRGGRSNALLGQYFHTSVFSMKLTDALFNLEYIAANVGGDLIKGGDVFMDEKDVMPTSGEITLKATAVPMKTGGTVYAYVRPANMPNMKPKKYVVTEDNKITGLEDGQAYCIRYMYTNASATKLVVSSEFIPDTLYAVMTANLFAGDNTAPTSGTRVGEITIKVPRYQLSGNQELTMTATGASQTNLEGKALASGAQGCDGNSIYAEIIQVLLDERWYTDAEGLVIEDSLIEMAHGDYKVGSAPVVYAWYPNARPKEISNAILKAQESNLEQSQTSKLVFAITAGDTGLSIDSSTGVISGTPAAGTATITVEAQEYGGTPIPGMDASATIILT